MRRKRYLVSRSCLAAQTAPIAIKSGGHDSNVGSSVDWEQGGVLVSSSKLASTSASLDQVTADVGSGT